MWSCRSYQSSRKLENSRPEIKSSAMCYPLGVRRLDLPRELDLALGAMAWFLSVTAILGLACVLALLVL